MKTLLNVIGMSCGHCEARIKTALGEISGVNQVTVNLAEGTVEIDYNENVTLDVIKEAIDDAGYDIA